MRQMDYIQQDLRQRIESGKHIPDKLTLAHLAAMYGVSSTPVRLAITALIEEKYIVKQPNGRLAVSDNLPSPVKRTTPVKITSPRTAEDWEALLIKEVMLTSLSSNPTFLREEALANKYEIGRSIIRQVLSRFAGSGLIDHIARCGWRVHPFNEEDMRAYLDIREALELRALDLARPHLLSEDLEAILKGNTSSTNNTEAHLDNRLHLYIIEKSGNRYIREFFSQNVSQYYSALFDYAAPHSEQVTEMAIQHRQILEALIAKAWPQARRALAEHIQSQHPIMLKLIEGTQP